MLRFLTAGESHGPEISAILEGMPAGVPVAGEWIDRDLARRQRGYGSGGRMKIERDHARLTGGVVAGRTTGAPIAISVQNLDYAKWRDRDIEPMTIPRPGHADLAGATKYDLDDLRMVGERASARETAMRVAAGSLARQLLAQFDIVVGSYVTEIGGELADLPDIPYMERFARARATGFRFVEYLFPYEYAVSALAYALQQNGLTQVLFNLPAGNWSMGERGIAAHPDRIGEFRDGVARAIEIARALNVPGA